MSDSEMFINFYDPDRKHPFYNMLSSLIFVNRDSFYHILYDAISEHPSYVILSDLNTESKLNIIDGMIKYFENKESYERCANLLIIKKNIKENAKD